MAINEESEIDWKLVAFDALDALQTFNAFYNDLAKSNPGFMGKLCLQNYGQWHEALLKSDAIQRKYARILKNIATDTEKWQKARTKSA